MSFEIKYDRNGAVIPNKELENIPKEITPDNSSVTSNLHLIPPEVTEESTQVEDQPRVEAISNEPAPSEEEYKKVAEQVQASQQKSKADNLRALREKAERLERERDEYMIKLQEAQAKKEEADDSDLSLGDADLAEGKHLKKLQQEIKRLRQESETNKQQSHITQAEIRLKSQYPDFDKVVSQDNIASLREEYPELAASINANSDLYSKAVSAYTMIKKLGIHQESLYTSDKARIAQNAIKPRPSATIAPQKSDSPLSQANAFANGLTPALQAQLRAEMEASRKGY